jgi:outer membrane protein TolC
MTAPSRDSISRWLPTIVALAGLAGSVYYFGERTGRVEQAVINLAAQDAQMEKRIDTMLPRYEYSAHHLSVNVQINDLKQSLRDANNKLDRIIERVK